MILSFFFSKHTNTKDNNIADVYVYADRGREVKKHTNEFVYG